MKGLGQGGGGKHVPGDVCTLTLASAHFSQILDERVHRVRAYANQQMPYENRFIGPLRRRANMANRRDNSSLFLVQEKKRRDGLDIEKKIKGLL